MKKYTVLIILTIFFILLPSFSKATGGDDDLLVKFNSNVSAEDIANKYNIDKSQIKSIDQIDTYQIDNPNFWQKTKLKIYQKLTDDIDYLEKNNTYHLLMVPNDTNYSNQWALNKISAPSSWDISIGSTNTIIAIVDTGINGLHQDLNGKVLAGMSYLDGGNQSIIGSNTDSDNLNHGTGISSVAAAITNNSLGMVGLDWQAKLMPIKVFNNDSIAYASDVANGIIYAADNGAKIINLSLGGASRSTTIENAIDYAWNKGCLIIAASGNDNSGVDYPAKYEKVIAVGASNGDDNRASFSNYGPELDVLSPGQHILHAQDTVGGNEYAYGDGTSLSAPYVSALAGIIWAGSPSLTNVQIKSRIEQNTDKVAAMAGANFTNEYGFGRINAYKVFSTSGSLEAQYWGQSVIGQVRPGEVINMWVKFKNNGTSAWFNNGDRPIRLAIDKLQDEAFLSRFKDTSWMSDNRITNMTDPIVLPGEVASFNFIIKIPDDIKAGQYKFNARLVAEGYSWFENPDTNGGAWWLINVPAPSSQLASQSNYDIKAWPGEIVSANISFRNTQGSTWIRNGLASTVLAVDKLEDESFLNKFKDSSWIGDYRIARLNETNVPNNSIGNFDFKIKIPDNLGVGVYKFNARLVQDGFSWFLNPDTNGGAWWQIDVPKPVAIWQSQSGFPTLNRGEDHTMWVKFINNTNKIWRTSDPKPVRLAIDKYWDVRTAWQGSGWLSENRITNALEGDVLPGGTGTYQFNIHVPTDMPSGKHKFYVRLVADGFSWFDNPDTNGACWWEITVR